MIHGYHVIFGTYGFWLPISKTPLIIVCHVRPCWSAQQQGMLAPLRHNQLQLQSLPAKYHLYQALRARAPTGRRELQKAIWRDLVAPAIAPFGLIGVFLRKWWPGRFSFRERNLETSRQTRVGYRGAGRSRRLNVTKATE